eukprot:1098844-Pyramimonas_sp.AAC.1
MNKKKNEAKQISLFSWIKARGFTSQCLQDTRSLIQSETLTRSKALLEFNELSAPQNHGGIR